MFRYPVMIGFSLLLNSCVTKILRDDSLAPIDAGMSRVETVACGHHAVGNNICWFNPGKSLIDVKIEVKTYLNGTVRLSSNECGLNQAVDYKDSKSVTFNLASFVTTLKKACVLSILVQPSFPRQEKSEIVVRGFSGHVFLVPKPEKASLAVLSGQDGGSGGGENDSPWWSGGGVLSLARVGNIGVDGHFKVSTHGSGFGKYIMSGCGRSITGTNSGRDELSFDLWQVLGGKWPKDSPCLFYGRYIAQDFSMDLVWAVALESYDKGLVALSEPVFSIHGHKLDFSSSEPVSWTFVDQEAINSADGRVSLSNPNSFVLRQITANGRSRVVKVKGGHIVWSY